MSDPGNKKSYLAMYEKVSQNRSGEHKQNGHSYPGLQATEEQREEKSPDEVESGGFLTDEMDHLILMHRDAHFGGDFQVMLEYYKDENHIGIHPDIDIDRIAYLSAVEKEIGQDIAPLMLTGPEAETVGKARYLYAQFKEIYSIENEKNPYPRLIADLVLSEEEEPLEAIEMVVSQGTAIVPDLLSLLNADELYDPLFPGYGFAPYLAIVCLGQIGDRRAIIPIFETLTKTTVYDETAIPEALHQLGEEAKQFLLQVLKSRPMTQDNPNAAFALIAFSDDPTVAIACFEQLQDPDVQDKPLLRTYLLGNCLTLPYREKFIDMARNPAIPSDLRSDMQQIIREWEERRN
jgi:hypothetical protein